MRNKPFIHLVSVKVEHIVKVVPDFAIKTLEFLLSDNNTEIQKAMEDLVARIFNFEHM